MTATIPELSEPPIEQRFVRSGVSWKDCKVIQRGFANSSGVRIQLELIS